MRRSTHTPSVPRAVLSACRSCAAPISRRSTRASASFRRTRSSSDESQSTRRVLGSSSRTRRAPSASPAARASDRARGPTRASCPSPTPTGAGCTRGRCRRGRARACRRLRLCNLWFAPRNLLGQIRLDPGEPRLCSRRLLPRRFRLGRHPRSAERLAQLDLMLGALGEHFARRLELLLIIGVVVAP